MTRVRTAARCRAWLRALTCLPFAWSLPFPASAQPQPFQIKSISFPLIGGSYLDDVPGWTPIPVVIQQLKSLGANDVKITVTDGYHRVTDNDPDPARTALLTPPDSQIVAFMRQLKAEGMQVTLQPFVSYEFDASGNVLDTVHAAPADFNAWMSAHATSWVHWAQLAQQAGADRFTIVGDETQNLTFDAARLAAWLDLIAKVRAVYSGSVMAELSANGAIFGPNGANGIDQTPKALLDALDVIGIGWFPQPLTTARGPDLARLTAAWRQNVAGVDSVAFMEGVHRKYNKPVFVADIAFHSYSGDNVNSTDIYDARIPLVADQREQADEYDSFIAVMSRIPGDWFLGASFDSWNRFPVDYAGVARFANSPYGENIRGKLAESVLSDWFNGRRAAVPPAVEYHHGAFDHYFLTNSPEEIAGLDAGTIVGWERTGYRLNVYGTSTTGAASVCRFFSTSFAPKSSHFYTPVADECAYVKENPDWAFEGEKFGAVLADQDGACSPGMQRLYRLYNDGQGGAPNHRYTTSPSVRLAMLAEGWVSEGRGQRGVIGCVLSDGRDNRIRLRLWGGTFGGASEPLVSVTIDGKTVLPPVVVEGHGTLQEILIDTTDVEPVSTGIEIAASGESNYPVRYSNVVVYGIVYQGQTIDVNKGLYGPPGSALINDNTLAVLNPGSKVIFPASALPRFDP